MLQKLTWLIVIKDMVLFQNIGQTVSSPYTLESFDWCDFGE